MGANVVTTPAEARPTTLTGATASSDAGERRLGEDGDRWGDAANVGRRPVAARAPNVDRV